MTDIHAHIMPGVDDGAQDFFEMVNMLDIAASSGIRTIVATPHANIPGSFKNYYDSKGGWYDRLFSKCLETIEKHDIPITMLSGMEIFATEDIDSLIKDGRVLPINSTRYFLIEFNFGEDPAFADYVVDKVLKTGALPVIAHPERYDFVQEYPDDIRGWIERGCAVQVNKGSFLGRFGKSAQKTAYRLMDLGCVTAAASDAHTPLFRKPYLNDAYYELLERYPEEYVKLIFEKNPQRICSGKTPVIYNYNTGSEENMR